MEMAVAQLMERIEGWAARLYRLSPERMSREKPLRSELLRRILLVLWAALLLNAATLYGRLTLFWFFWTAVEPALLVALATGAAWRGKTHSAAVLLLVGVGHAAIFTQAHYGMGSIAGVLLALTIIVCGLLLGAYFVRAWTAICCAMVIWTGYAVHAPWTPVVGWCCVYLATGWLAGLFSRHLERLLEATRHAEQQRQEAIVAERTRLAREMHDTLAQGFTGILMQINAAEQRVEGDPASVLAHLDKARQLAKESLGEARRAVHELMPGTLEREGLFGAVREAGVRLTAGSNVAFAAAVEGSPYPLPAECERHLLRIAQEGLANAMSHAAAAHIAVRLTYSAGAVGLEVSDDGRGIDPDRPAGMGLENMKERVRQLGGDFRIQSGPGTGTSIVATVPSE
jgi:signal transduction histidine kinase